MEETFIVNMRLYIEQNSDNITSPARVDENNFLANPAQVADWRLPGNIEIRGLY
jgi:hypothetical protein